MNVRANTPGRRRILEALAGIALLGVVAVVLLPPILLRTSLDEAATGDRVE